MMNKSVVSRHDDEVPYQASPSYANLITAQKGCGFDKMLPLMIDNSLKA